MKTVSDMFKEYYMDKVQEIMTDSDPYKEAKKTKIGRALLGSRRKKVKLLKEIKK